MMAGIVNQAVGHKDCQNHRITETGPVLCSILPSTSCPPLWVRVSNYSGMFPSFLVNFQTFWILHLLCYCPLCLKWPLVPLRHLLCLRHQTTEIQIFCLPTKVVSTGELTRSHPSQVSTLASTVDSWNSGVCLPIRISLTECSGQRPYYSIRDTNTTVVRATPCPSERHLRRAAGTL